MKSEKQKIRDRIKLKWKKLTETEKKSLAKNMLKQLENLSDWKKFTHILVFYPMSDEIPFWPELQKKFPEKHFYFPRVDKEMRFFLVKNSADLISEKMGIMEPIKNLSEAQYSHIDFALVPAVALGKNGERLGRGAGFYDRFLAKFPRIKTASFVPNFALFDNLPTEKHDQKIDWVLMEQ